MGLKLIEAPSVEPITADEIRDRLGIGSTVTDSVINSLIKGARQEIDGAAGWLGRAIITQDWELSYDSFPVGPIKIPLPPLQEILSVKYDDADGVEQTVYPADYEVDLTDGWVVPVESFSWPSTLSGINAVRVRFRCGYGDAGEDVDERIRQWITDKVSYRRVTMRSDPALRSETVDGVGSRSWSTGGSGMEGWEKSIDNSLSTLRIWTL